VKFSINTVENCQYLVGARDIFVIKSVQTGSGAYPPAYYLIVPGVLCLG